MWMAWNTTKSNRSIRSNSTSHLSLRFCSSTMSAFSLFIISMQQSTFAITSSSDFMDLSTFLILYFILNSSTTSWNATLGSLLEALSAGFWWETGITTSIRLWWLLWQRHELLTMSQGGKDHERVVTRWWRKRITSERAMQMTIIVISVRTNWPKINREHWRLKLYQSFTRRLNFLQNKFQYTLCNANLYFGHKITPRKPTLETDIGNCSSSTSAWDKWNWMIPSSGKLVVRGNSSVTMLKMTARVRSVVRPSVI